MTTVDEDHQEVVVDEPANGEFFGFASMLEQTPHQTSAIALEESACLEVSRDDIEVLLQKKPHAGMDLLTVLGRQFHASQGLIRIRANRNPNEMIEKEARWASESRIRWHGLGGRGRSLLRFWPPWSYTRRSTSR